MGRPRVREERQALQSALLLRLEDGRVREGVAYLDIELFSQLWS
jgi:hypothetical protein